MLLAALAAVCVATAAHAPTGIALGALLAGVTLLAARVLPDGGLDQVYARLAPTQHEIARIHSARAVVFGHTHIAQGAWSDDVFVGNCGTWAPMFHDIACTRPVQVGFPFVWLRASEDGALHGGLYRVTDGACAAVAGSVREGVQHDDLDDRGHTAA